MKEIVKFIQKFVNVLENIKQRVSFFFLNSKNFINESYDFWNFKYDEINKDYDIRSSDNLMFFYQSNKCILEAIFHYFLTDEEGKCLISL